MNCSLNSSPEKIVRTVREFCQKNRENSVWPSSESALRAIVQEGDESPFAPAIVRYNRRVLIDIDEWQACLIRLQKIPHHQPLTKENSNAQNIKRRPNRLAGTA